MSSPRETVAEKAELRRTMAEVRRRLGLEQHKSASANACNLLLQQPAWRDAPAVLLYAPMPDELDVWPLAAAALRDRKRLGLPRFDQGKGLYHAFQVENLENDIEVGWYGIREPVAACRPFEVNRLDLILVPGVAFDWHGSRLGRGKGYYDRLLATMHGIRCGVAFDEQVVSKVPATSHDVSLNCILTPTRWVLF